MEDPLDRQSSTETKSLDLLDVDWQVLGALLAVRALGLEEDTESDSSDDSDDSDSKSFRSSLDRAAEILSNMNEQDRNTLLAPIQQGLLDLKSVFYLKDASGTQEIAICVEDFLYVIAKLCDSGVDVGLLTGDDFLGDDVPVRLADAVRRMSINPHNGETDYSVIENASSGYSSAFASRSSRVDSNLSAASNDTYFPRIPSSRPPVSSLSSAFREMVRQSRALRNSLRQSHRGRVQPVVTVPRMLPLAVDDRAAFVVAARSLNHVVDHFSELRSQSPSVEDFLQTHMQNRFVAIELAAEYGRLMESLRISTTEELQQRTEAADSPETASAILLFLAAEQRWDAFLKSVDEDLNVRMNDTDVNHVVGLEAGDIRLTDCRSSIESTLANFLHPVFGRYTLVCMLRFFGCPACLAQIMSIHERRDEFEANLCNIVMVCKGTTVAGSRWLKLAGITFPLLSDARLEFVQALKFRRSVYALSNSQLSRKFGQMARANTSLELSTLVDDRMHDIYQLGGHVLLDSTGRVVFAFKCCSFDDWPTPDRLLELISQAEIDDRMRRLRLRTDSRLSRLSAADHSESSPPFRSARNSVNAHDWLPGHADKTRKCIVL